MHTSFNVFLALLARDIKVISKTLLTSLINNAIFVFFQVLVYGHLLKYVGYTPDKLPPAVIGSVIMTFFIIGFNKALEVQNSIEQDKRMEYEQGLPISQGWLIGKYATMFIIHYLINYIPIAIFTGVLLSQSITFKMFSLGSFILMSFMSILFFTFMFLSIVFGLSVHAFRHYVWARVLLPLSFFAPLYYPLGLVNKFLPGVGKLMLFNPFTYVTEGVRGSILGVGVLSFTTCYMILGLITIVLALVLKVSFKKRLDHV